MPRPPAVSRSTAILLRAAIALTALALALIAAGAGARGMAARRLRAAAAERGWTASWRTLEVSLFGSLSVGDLVLARTPQDTVLSAATMTVAIAPWSLLVGRVALRRVALRHAHARIGANPADPDTLSLPGAARGASPERARRLQHAAETLARLLLAPARSLPRVELNDVLVRAGGDGAFGLELRTLTARPSGRTHHLVAAGTLGLDRAMPFECVADYGRDDRLAGRLRVDVPSAGGGGHEPLVVGFEGGLVQDPATGVARLSDSSRVTLGTLPLAVTGAVARRGPRFTFALAAHHVSQEQVFGSLPRALLGRLLEVSVRGTFDYRLRFDLDLARPDSVDVYADVVPAGLALDPSATRLNLLGLDAPFRATIHLPRGRTTTRSLSPDNPHFVPLAELDSLLVHAVVTNEDGAFFRHRGFNLEAVKESIAENIRAGAYRRGAGTITMQLMRNLYLGHERTLSRKLQEAVLAWIAEHLTGVRKDRLLEIYLNVIEWGPDVQGADEAARYYFGHDARRTTVDEALFLATLVPAPTKWRYRFEPDGSLRAYARSQMHFIGRAMVAKGWLAPDALPPEDSLRVELNGPARDVLFPPPPTDASPEIGARWDPRPHRKVSQGHEVARVSIANGGRP